MHLAAGWSFRHRRTVLTGWPPPYSPAEAGQMNASRTVAFASLAPVAAAQDVPEGARPPVAGRPRGTARRRRPDPQWPLDREGRGDALLLGGAEKQGLPGNRGRLAPPTPPGSPSTASPGLRPTRYARSAGSSPRASAVAARTTSMPGTAGPWTSKPTGGQQPSAPPARAIAITSIGTGTARIALI